MLTEKCIRVVNKIVSRNMSHNDVNINKGSGGKVFGGHLPKISRKYYGLAVVRGRDCQHCVCL